MEIQRTTIMKIKTLLLCTATLSLGAYSAYGESSTSGPRYVPRDQISQTNYTQTNHAEDRADEESYGAYEQREPCQNYRELPRSLVNNCATEEMLIAAAETPARETRLLPVVQSYTLLFDFDKSAVRSNENETLNRALREINKYDPKQITVTGYTDSSGQSDYNQNLSREREQAVSKALLERGIANQTLDREARGEYEQAVKTADDTRNQENRRVVIDFRR
jgi:OOP family OmpA-OmpF porin